jgi:hypothetical protein
MDLYEQEGTVANQVVVVTVTETDNHEITWTFGAPVAELNAGDTLSWEFQGVPSDCVPTIVFDSDSHSRLGPFQALELKGNLVTGRGNNGQTGTYSYHAQLLDLKGVRSKSPTFSVLNPLTEEDTSPMAVIAYTFDFKSDPPRIAIANINPLRLFVGSTAVWFATGLPPGFFVDFLFKNPADNSLIAPPFESLLFTRQLEGEGSVALKVIGLSFKPGALKSVTYSIQVRNFSGEVIPPPDDPQIDSLGQPPQGG